MDLRVIKNRLNYLKNKKKYIQEHGLDHLLDNKNKVSVIIPTYKGEKYIIKCVDSLKNQSLDKNLYEVIIIINGEKDNTSKLLSSFIAEHQLENFIVVYSDVPSVSNARNIGLETAKYDYITFIDDDDYVSTSYLKGLLKDATENSIVCSYFIDVNESTREQKKDNYINQFIMSNSGRVERNLNKAQPLLSAVAGKVVHRNIIGNTRFDINLKNGEDVVFFSEISNKIKKIIITADENTIYYRLLRKGSVSRQTMSFKFNVIERLAVIERLNSLLKCKVSKYDSFLIKSRIKAQSSFIKKYIQTNPEEYLRVFQKVHNNNLVHYFPYNKVFGINKDKKLVISYCFPPYNDPSGIVMMKRVVEDFIENQSNIDVIQNTMRNHRKKDMKLVDFIDMFIRKRVELQTPQYFNHIAQLKFARQAYNTAKGMHKSEKYKELYSRAMWPGSHFAALFVKLRYPRLRWVAEFSDPMLYREGKIRKSGKFDYIDNFWFWLECLTYLFANEVIFTNINQLEYMVNYFPLKLMTAMITKKSKVINQPCLSKKYYNYVKSGYTLDKSKINIGYFGSFYKDRSISHIIAGIKHLCPEQRERFNIYVFTNDIKEINEYFIENGLSDIIKINEYIEYFRFLNMCLELDVLLVNDTISNNVTRINPYLPSKYSDYKGSGTDIWAVVEEGSALSMESKIKYKSFNNSLTSILNTYGKIYEDFIAIKTESILDKLNR